MASGRAMGWVAAILMAAAGHARAAGDGTPPQTANVLAPVGPLGHWKGDDAATAKSVADASGNGFNGTLSAGATLSTTVAATKFPNPGSINLDGASGVVTVADSPALRITGDLTIAFWKRKTANAKDWTRMIGKGNGGQRNFGVWESPEGEGRILFQQYDNNGRSVIDLMSSNVTALNAWTHIVCCVSVNSAQMFINGQLVANGQRNGDLPGTSADPLTFGFAGFHAFWPGQLDDIRIYNRALSMSEVVYLANGNGPPAEPKELAAAGASAEEVALKWAASATPPPAGTSTYYLVKRSPAAGKDYAVVGSMLSGTSFKDQKVEPGKTYYYRVTAVNTGGESGPSNELTVAVPAK